jgi:Transposase DDE domain
MTSGAKSDGRFGKQDFVYLPGEDAYRCPAGERLPYRYTNEEAGKMLRRYWTNACKNCSIKSQCTPGSERRITRWEHEHLLDAVQQRLDTNPLAMRQRRETVEHPFGTMKARMGATHPACRIQPGHQRRWAFEKLHAVEIQLVLDRACTASIWARQSTYCRASSTR